MKESNLKLLWPEIDSYEAATHIMCNGSAAAALNCVITSTLVVAAISGHPMLGVDAWSSLDAIVLGIVAWRMFKLSLPWAIFGLLYFAAEKMWMIYSHDLKITGIFVGALFFLYYFHAVRAGFAIRSMRSPAQGIKPTDFAARVNRDL